MALEALSASELLNFIMYNDSSNINIDTAPLISCSNIINDNTASLQTENAGAGCSAVSPPAAETAAAQGGRKKRRRRAKVCKNKEEAENQRMTHIAVERNRRKQMNEHLAVLRSLMPESYVQRGDQASIVGGAIEFVKELEHMLQSLEAKKFSLLNNNNNDCDVNLKNNLGDHHDNNNENLIMTSPFSQFFSYPQFSCSSSQNNSSNCNNNNNNMGSKYTSQSKAAVADIEVTLIETHANIRILSRRRVRQLSKIVASFQSVLLTILHLNVTTFDSRVLYSISAKVEEGCQLSSADDIATTVHHMLRIIEEEAAILCSHQP